MPRWSACGDHRTHPIGAGTRIFQFASVGEEPQDKKFAGEESELVIGSNNTIREFVTINRGTRDGGGVTRLGDDNWLMAYVHIAHDCQVGSHCVFANGTTLAGHVVVGNHVTFAGFSGAHQFCHIGDHAFLGMYGGVGQDVPAYVMISGRPPRPRGINSEGLKRRGFDASQIRNIREAYKLMYIRGGARRCAGTAARAAGRAAGTRAFRHQYRSRSARPVEMTARLALAAGERSGDDLGAAVARRNPA